MTTFSLFFRSNKNKLLLVVLLLILIIIYAFYSQKSLVLPRSSRIISSSALPPNETEPFTPLSFLSNQIFSSSNTLGVISADDSFLVITSEGIIQTSSNSLVVPVKIQQIISTNQHSALVLGNGFVYFVNSITSVIIPINNLSKLTLGNNNILCSYSPTSSNVSIIFINQETKHFTISGEVDYCREFDQHIIIATKSPNKIYIFDTNFNLQDSYELLPQEKVVGYFLNNLLITQFNSVLVLNQSDSIKTEVSFQSGSNLKVFQINNELYVFETMFAKYGSLDYLWKISSNGNKEYFTNTSLIPGEIDFDSMPPIVKGIEVIPLVSPNYGVWLQGLQPNKLPRLNPEGKSVFVQPSINFSFDE